MKVNKDDHRIINIEELRNDAKEELDYMEAMRDNEHSQRMLNSYEKVNLAKSNRELMARLGEAHLFEHDIDKFTETVTEIFRELGVYTEEEIPNLVASSVNFKFGD